MAPYDRSGSDLAVILDRLPVGILLVDAQDQVTYWNPAFLGLFQEASDVIEVGLPYEAALRRLLSADPPDRPSEQIERHVAAGMERHRSRQHYQYQRRDGRWYEVAAHDLPDGRLMKVWTDVTRSRYTGAAKTRLDDALAAIDVGLAIYDSGGRYLLSNRALDEIFPSTVGLHRPGVHYAEHLRDYIDNALVEEDGRKLGQIAEHALSASAAAAAGDTYRTRDQRYLTLTTHIGQGGELFTVWQDVTADRRNQRLLQDGSALLEQVAGNVALAEVLANAAAMVEAHGWGLDCAVVLFTDDRPTVHHAPDVDSPALGTAAAAALDAWCGGGLGAVDRPRPGTRQSAEIFLAHYERAAAEVGWRIAAHRTLGPEDQICAGLMIALKAADSASPAGAHEIAVLDRAAQIAGLAIERDRRVQAVQLAREAAEVANRAKSDFLAKMSHELRTPLNAIIGFAEMMSLGIGSPTSERNTSYATIIRQSGQHLLAIINDILDISRIESGHVALTEEPTSLNELWADCAEIVSPQARERGIKFVEDGVRPTTVLCDPTKIRQCMLNLLSNAVKFSPEDGTIRVSIALTASGDAEFSVTDTGSGMDEAQTAQALRPFGQVDPRRAAERSGLGLGLPITKALMELHGGRLTLVSAPGTGTRAILALPDWRRLPAVAETETERGAGSG